MSSSTYSARRAVGHQEPSWCQFYDDTQSYENGQEQQLYYYNTVSSHTPLPNLTSHTVQNYPQFDLGIPDQFRFDIWKQDFANDVANGTVPQLEFMWISSDHTGGPPNAMAMQADNDLALGRYVEASPTARCGLLRRSSSRKTTRRTASTISTATAARAMSSAPTSTSMNSDGPSRVTDHTFYTQVNMTRTIEQILGITPMNQFDLVGLADEDALHRQPPRRTSSLGHTCRPRSRSTRVLIRLRLRPSPSVLRHLGRRLSPSQPRVPRLRR